MAVRKLGRIRQRLIELIRRSGYRTLLKDALYTIIEVINKGGPRKQLQFLLQLVGTDETERIVKDMVANEKAVKGWCYEVESYGLHEAAIRAVYDEHIKEAHAVIREGIKAQLRYLVRRRGIVRVRDFIAYHKIKAEEKLKENTKIVDLPLDKQDS